MITNYSAVGTKDSVVIQIQIFESFKEAFEYATEYGLNYVVLGSQLSGEPVGMIEESNKKSKVWTVDY